MGWMVAEKVEGEKEEKEKEQRGRIEKQSIADKVGQSLYRSSLMDHKLNNRGIVRKIRYQDREIAPDGADKVPGAIGLFLALLTTCPS